MSEDEATRAERKYEREELRKRKRRPVEDEGCARMEVTPDDAELRKRKTGDGQKRRPRTKTVDRRIVNVRTNPKSKDPWEGLAPSKGVGVRGGFKDW